MLEVQRDMAGPQCDVAHSFGSLLSSFAAFELEPRRVGGPTRHGGGPIRHGALFLIPFGLFCHLGGGATSCWKPNTTWRRANTTWRTLLTRFLGDLVPLGWRHFALEAQYDVVRSSCSLLGCFGALEAEPRRVGGPTRHGSLPIRRGGAHHNLAPPFSGHFNT